MSFEQYIWNCRLAYHRFVNVNDTESGIVLLFEPNRFTMYESITVRRKEMNPTVLLTLSLAAHFPITTSERPTPWMNGIVCDI